MQAGSPNSGRLKDEHILVTGGGSGIGEAIVDKALAEGARVSVIELGAHNAQKLRARLDGTGKLHVSQGDITQAAALAAGHKAAVARFGNVTGLVNNAGRNSYADPVTMTEPEWDAFFALDLKAAWLCSRCVLPSMISGRRGAIVNICSVHADHTQKGYFPYAAAKSGLVGLTRSLALEVAPHQIRVNALSPGWTETALVRDYFAKAGPAARQEVLDVHPMGRIGTPAEIANCVAFLLSAEASFVTGVNWRVDGGLGARFAG